MKLRGFALHLHVVVEAGIVFPYDVPLLLLSFSSLCDSVHKKKMNVNAADALQQFSVG